MDEYSYAEIKNELEAECATKKYKWDFSDALCHALRSKCYPWWEARYNEKAHANLPMCSPDEAPANAETEQSTRTVAARGAAGRDKDEL